MSTYTRIATGDALAVLRHVPGESNHSCVTSPPYWGLRDYGVEGQLGQEPTPQEYISRLMAVFGEVWRVLRGDGTCWVVIGDRYVNKSLAMIPARFAIAMTDAGWLLRNAIVWHKPNAIPTSVKDRFTVDYELVFFFTKEKTYYFDPQCEKSLCPGSKHVHKRPGSKGEFIHRTVNSTYFIRNIITGEYRNRRCVWTIPTARCAEEHYAVYPEKLIETPIMAGCPVGGTVLDPFSGVATTAIVCERLGRSFMGVEINPAYVQIAKRRIQEARDARR